VIPWAHIVGWRNSAPWISHAQVEQDLIMSRALVAIFQEPFLAGRLAFRGGTGDCIKNRQSGEEKWLRLRIWNHGPDADRIDHIYPR